MPLRPIDAIFVHFEQRQYVVYYRGELWQLPRMKIDDASWQRRKPYNGATSELYLSRHQAISDPILAQKLRTLNLPAAIRGSTLPRFEAWWENQGFEWLKDKLSTGQSPLAAHDEMTSVAVADTQAISKPNHKAGTYNDDKSKNTSSVASITSMNSPEVTTAIEKGDVFASMLADLAEEVLHQPL